MPTEPVRNRLEEIWDQVINNDEPEHEVRVPITEPEKKRRPRAEAHSLIRG